VNINGGGIAGIGTPAEPLLPEQIKLKFGPIQFTPRLFSA
jgi:hypothetical protein